MQPKKGRRNIFRLTSHEPFWKNNTQKWRNERKESCYQNENEQKSSFHVLVCFGATTSSCIHFQGMTGEVFKDNFEYVGHDLLSLILKFDRNSLNFHTAGNYAAKRLMSNYQRICKWDSLNDNFHSWLDTEMKLFLWQLTWICLPEWACLCGSVDIECDNGGGRGEDSAYNYFLELFCLRLTGLGNIFLINLIMLINELLNVLIRAIVNIIYIL